MSEEAAVVNLAERRGRARMDYILQLYHREHPDEDPNTVEPHLVARWAVENGHYRLPPLNPEERFRQELARYLKNEYVKDPQGRLVRLHHAVVYPVQTAKGVKHRSRWCQIFEASAEHMRAALQLRRRAAVADVIQLDLDFESWNDNNRRGETLPAMDYNFNPDVEESKLPTEYLENGPEDDFDEEL